MTPESFCSSPAVSNVQYASDQKGSKVKNPGTRNSPLSKLHVFKTFIKVSIPQIYLRVLGVEDIQIEMLIFKFKSYLPVWMWVGI